MKEIALNILDIANNSIRAGCKTLKIEIEESEKDNFMKLTITDDGCGMDEEFLMRVTDPFTTTRTTRPVGMGIPLFKMAAEMAGGSLNISSKKGEGTCLRADFQLSHIDRPPLGDMAGTIAAIIQSTPEMKLVYELKTDEGDFTFKTEELKDVLGDVSLSEPEVVEWIREYVRENELSLH